MRGAGKTWVGEVAARALGRDLIDADVYMTEQVGQPLGDFVAEKGWPAFRAEETRILKILMEKHAQGHVISLGGGVVETPEARELLKQYGQTQGPVVYVVRPTEEIMAFLDVAGRPPYGESNMDVFTRRAPWYAETASYRFFNHTAPAHRSTSAPTAYPTVSAQTDRSEVARFFRFVTGSDLNRPTSLLPPRRSTFLSLTFPEVTPALPLIDDITAGVDAIELRVDLLAEDGKPVAAPKVPAAEYVALQLAALRQRTGLPIVFSVRTHSQGGMFPDNQADAYFALLDLAVQLGCEYIDLEVGFPEDRLAAFVARKSHSHVIASWHNWSGSMAWDGAEAREKHALAVQYGDVAKLVGKANTMADNFALRGFVARAAAESDVPLLAINMGAAGQLSRVLNTVLSPVTHPALPVRAAPGQLSFAELQQARHLLGEVPARQFHLFGAPIAHSLSPTLHNTAFRTLGLPHTYAIHETDAVNDGLRAVLAAPDFGGANVTIPLKVDVLPLLDSVSDDARAVGAVNTIVPVTAADGSRTLHGDNTDWLAIRDLCTAKLPAGARLTAESTGLVIGAGGTCRAAVYALHALGLATIYLFNRTRASADAIVGAFPARFNIVVVDSLATFPGPAPTVIVGTIPGQATTVDAAEASTLIHLPAELLAAAAGGVVLDMAYKPFPTPLLTLAQQTPGWSAVPGLSALLVQGFYSFEKWTAIRAPAAVVEAAVWAKYLA
jgi:pentafunctional AROM polypeptide